MFRRNRPYFSLTDSQLGRCLPRWLVTTDFDHLVSALRSDANRVKFTADDLISNTFLSENTHTHTYTHIHSFVRFEESASHNNN